MIYKDNNSVSPSKCVDTKFIVEGQRVRKSELAKYTQMDQEETKRLQVIIAINVMIQIVLFVQMIMFAKDASPVSH